MTRFHSPCPVLALAFLLFASPAFAAPFTDNLDGTVTDDATGLIWDKCSWGQSNDTDCSTGSASTHTWAEALDVAVTANAASYKGHDDWRLPNRTELESLVDLSTSDPAIDTDAFPNTPSNWHWTSTTYALVPADAWLVSFNTGLTRADSKADTNLVRLVRSGQSFDAFDALAPPPPPQGDPTAIPTLAEWAVLMLAGLLALIGSAWLRRPFPHRDA